MGVKITFDAANREFVVVGPPVNGVIEIDLRIDLYSDGKEDWVDDITYPELGGMQFPVDPIGGNQFGTLELGISYLILNGWHFKPYEADHTMRIIGNIGTESEWELVQDTVGAFRVRVENEVSALVETTEATIPQGLQDDISSIETSITAIEADIVTLLAGMNLTSEQQVAEHTTDPGTGTLILRNTVALRRWEAPIWEDVAQTIAYGTNLNGGLQSAGQLVEVAYS